MRAVLVRVAAGALAIGWGFFFFGLTDLLAFAQGPDYHRAMLLSTGWGLLFLFLVAAPLMAAAVAPRTLAPAAVCQVTAAAAAVALAAVVSGSPRQLGVAAGLAVTASVVLALDGGLAALRRLRWRAAAGPAVLVVVAAGPLAAYAWHSAQSTGSSPVSSYTAGLDHWPIQAALPLAVLLITTMAAGHPRGWRVPAWSATAAVAWFAVVSGLEPHLPASAGRGWSVAAGLWALGFLVTAERSAPATAGRATSG